jgi:hypothetical protein
MLAAFSFGELAKGFGILSIIVFALILVIRGLHRKRLSGGTSKPKTRARAIFAVVAAAMSAIGISGSVLTILDVTQAWRVFWIPNSVVDLNKLVFPDLNGKWVGAILSNGPQHGYRDSLRHLPKTECEKLFRQAVDEMKFVCLPVNYSISMSLFRIKMELISGDYRSESKSVSLKRKTEMNAQITYLFDVREQNPSNSDRPLFMGAAVLDIKDIADWELDGVYWTDRDWEAGKQTAGHVVLTRSTQ